MLIADLHIHSSYSRATSPQCNPEHLELWARRKGIGLLGTGDFTHPAWRKELRQKLCPAEDGLYVLAPEYRIKDGTTPDQASPRFVVSGEISSIYKKNGKVRKVHNLILLPGLEAAEALSRKLEAIGNIHSDGRPILGLDSRDLLEITLETSPDAIFIPAHIWTPHFSMFGAFSGFDTIEECFEDLTPHIHALETGLSSDPAMNWRLSALDPYILVSNSDAHSPAKLGREANLLDIGYSYSNLAAALRDGISAGFAGTIEFFPEEGKYHLDGHRSCKLCLTPEETEQYGGKCPVCGRKITIGVQHRVEQLADRAAGYLPAQAVTFESLMPLQEAIASCNGCSDGSVKVERQYDAMLRTLGSEFYILRQAPLEDIRHAAGDCVAEGIRRLRLGQVERNPGFDGQYGTIQLLNAAEIDALSGQLSLFPGFAAEPKRAARKSELKKALSIEAEESAGSPAEFSPNEEQRQAKTAFDPVVAVVAGPGTGKTKTLVSRIAWLIQNRGVKPSEITAVTFTNKAAGELKERLEKQFNKRLVRSMQIGTFHSICLDLLSALESNVTLIDQFEALDLAAAAVRELEVKLSAKQLLQEVSKHKSGLRSKLSEQAFQRYEALLADAGAVDFDDLLLHALSHFEAPEDKNKKLLRPFTHLLVDEFQDINQVQYRLVRAWNKAGKSLFVIGDPDQSIYGFRGSDANCFQQLASDYPDLREIRLTQNYRSTPEILSCALPVISKNGGPSRILLPTRPSGCKVDLFAAESELSEAIFVAKEISRLTGGMDMLDAQNLSRRLETEPARDFSDIAILYRTHRQAEVLEKCLRRDSIPYLVAGQDDTLADETVRGTLGFFRFLLDPQDLLSLRLTLKLLWKCPEDIIEFVVETCRRAGLPEQFDVVLAQFSDTEYLKPWCSLLRKYRSAAQKQKPWKLLDDWMEELHCTASKPMERLRSMSVFHPDLPSFLKNLVLGQEGDLQRCADKTYISGAVSLMTLHGAKGLEFPVVFLCGAEQDRIPLKAAVQPAELQEERRLFYVGMTRARDRLILLHSGPPSPFLSDIPEAYHTRGMATGKKNKTAAKQLSLFDL